jgi:hypothetical protein
MHHWQSEIPGSKGGASWQRLEEGERRSGASSLPAQNKVVQGFHGGSKHPLQAHLWLCPRNQNGYRLVKNTGTSPWQGTTSDNLPKLKSGRTIQAGHRLEEAEPAWHKASPIRSPRMNTDMTQVRGSRWCTQVAGNQQSNGHRGHVSKARSGVHGRRRGRQWSKPCGAFANATSYTPTSLPARAAKREPYRPYHRHPRRALTAGRPRRTQDLDDLPKGL